MHVLASEVFYKGATPMDEHTATDVYGIASKLAGTETTIETLKVSSQSRPSAVAGAIAGVIREQRAVEIQTIGAGATGQAIKAIAIAHTFLAAEGIEIVCVPAFIEVFIQNEERTALRLSVFRR
jgi:stage V sporulation protein S